MWNEKIQDMILYEDKEILVCQKPPGLAVQSAGVGKADMESCLKEIRRFAACMEYAKDEYLRCEQDNKENLEEI